MKKIIFDDGKGNILEAELTPELIEKLQQENVDLMSTIFNQQIQKDIEENA